MSKTITEIIRKIKPLDKEAMALVKERQDDLTKPQGSLGRLEELSIQLAGIYSQVDYQINKKTIIVMAADHGVVEEGVSLYPQEVTAQMVYNFLAGGAGINVLSQLVGADVKVVDIGVKENISEEGLIKKKIRPGTRNIRQGPAMSIDETEKALEIGMDLTNQEIKNGTNLLGIGEMGIGNTTTSSALISVLTGYPTKEVTGGGTGLSKEMIQHKVKIVDDSIRKNQPYEDNPIDVLAKLGGLEIAGLVGVILGGAAARVPVIIDGFISGAAALVAVKINSQVKEYLIPSHLSSEPGHHLLLKKMNLKPLLDLDLRLGEGTGSALAMNLVEAAAKVLNEMATFDTAGVSKAEESN